jgi:cysteine-rich repeat protein
MGERGPAASSPTRARRALFCACLFAFGCSAYDKKLLDEGASSDPIGSNTDSGSVEPPPPDASAPTGQAGAAPVTPPDAGSDAADATDTSTPTIDPLTCSWGQCWWSDGSPDACASAGKPTPEDRPHPEGDGDGDAGDIYLGWTRIRLGSSLPDGTASMDAWTGFGLDLDGICTNSATCPEVVGQVACRSLAPQIPFDGDQCRDNVFGSLQPIAAQVPQIGETFGISENVFNCELWNGGYNIVLRVSGYNGRAHDSQVRVDFYMSDGLETAQPWQCRTDENPDIYEEFSELYPVWRTSLPWRIDESTLTGAIEEAGTLPDSTVADPEAYVRSNYLVARLPDGALMRLAGAGDPYRGFPLVIQQGIWVGHLFTEQDGTWSIRDGLATGRITKEDLVRGFRQVGFCPGMELDAFYDAMVSYVDENADVLASGANDPEADCDALSLGIAFEAKQLTPGAAVAVDPLIECCAPGRTIAQCQAVCGDGQVSGDEHCDTAIEAGQPGACATSCSPLDACTQTVLSGEQCATHCEPMPITAFNTGDDCCPEGADATEDGDCTSVCDNGVIETGETCDPIATCSVTCTSTNPCLTAVPSGSAADCTADCDFVAITACGAADDCCPGACTQANDADCSASCGDTVIDASAGETCEAGSATPCPADCDDDDACTEDVRTGSSANCNVVCTHAAVTRPLDGDACCPEGANANNDDDCEPECGNDALEDGELCDGNCPSSCSDDMVCTRDTLAGAASTCDARCTYPVVTAPAHGDGCCPANGSGNGNTDDDCPSVCGNDVIEPGELCDDGGTAANDGCGATCQIEADQAMCLALLPQNNACGQCNCSSCRNQTVACYGSSSAAANMRCAALVACAREHGCTGNDCYCGTADDFLCLFGFGNGPCKSEVEAAAQSQDPLTISTLSTDTNSALGRANALGACARTSCVDPCDL